MPSMFFQIAPLSGWNHIKQLIGANRSNTTDSCLERTRLEHSRNVRAIAPRLVAPPFHDDGDRSLFGQILTCASGLHAATIIWIAPPFTEEHGTMLDRPIKIADEIFRFFRLAAEFLKIGES